MTTPTPKPGEMTLEELATWLDRQAKRAAQDAYDYRREPMLFAASAACRELAGIRANWLDHDGWYEFPADKKTIASTNEALAACKFNPTHP